MAQGILVYIIILERWSWRVVATAAQDQVCFKQFSRKVTIFCGPRADPDRGCRTDRVAHGTAQHSYSTRHKIKYTMVKL